MKLYNTYIELLIENFKTQRERFIQQGHSPNVVDTYLKDFDEIRKAKFREARDAKINGLGVPTGEPRFNIDSYKTFRELEILVDYVAGQRRVGSANFEDIEVDGKPIFRNEEVEIYYADTPRACIQYKGNFPYSWCVARNDSGNMFYDYRLDSTEPAFYFVKQIGLTEREFENWEREKFNGKFKYKYHFFVLQVTKYKNYIVTSAQNDGDIEMGWDEILKICPRLLTLKHIFQPKPLTPFERKIIENYKKGISDEEFAKLSYKEKDFYLSVYPKPSKPITYKQFEILPEDLKNKYIGFEIGLSDEQFELIKDNKKLIKRYSEVTKKKFDKSLNANFTNSEKLFIQDKINEKFDDVFDYLTEYKNTKDSLIKLIKNTKDDIEKNLYIDKFIKIELSKKNIEIPIELLKYSLNPDEIAYKIVDYERENLSYFDIEILLKNTVEKDGIISDIIKYKNKSLDYDTISILLKYLSKKDEFINFVLNLKKKSLDSRDISMLLYYSPKKTELIDYIINLKGESLNNSDVKIILSHLTDENYNRIVDYLINLKKDSLSINELLNLFPHAISEIINIKGNSLTGKDAMYILQNVNFEKKLKTAKKIISKIDKSSLDSSFITYILINLDFYNIKEEIINYIIEYKGILLDEIDIKILLYMSRDKSKTIDKLLEIGINKDLINKAIDIHNDMSMASKIDNINENYIILNEQINRIKSMIMLK